MQPKRQSAPSIPDELIGKILLCLPVKSLMYFKSVCKSWNSLISEPHFINQHLERSAAPKTNPHVLFAYTRLSYYSDQLNISFFPIKSLLESHSSIDTHPFFSFKNSSPFIRHEVIYKVIGSCNGLICLSYQNSNDLWVYFFNPATRSMSRKSPNVTIIPDYHHHVYGGFGYDSVSDTYKAVLFLNEPERSQVKSQVKVFTMGDMNWRDIDIGFLRPVYSANEVGVYLNGSLNWITYDVDKYARWTRESTAMIISFDLNKEECHTLSLPRIFPKFHYPYLGILDDCLCVSYDDNGIRFVVLKKVGVDESWSELLNISFEDIQFHRFEIAHWFPLYIFDNGDILLLQQKMLYRPRDKSLQFLQIPKDIVGYDAMIYFESLVSPR